MSLTWYFPVDKDWVLACDWNPVQGSYNRNCRRMRKAYIPNDDTTTDMVSDVAEVLETTKQSPPATWYFPTELPDWVLSCDLNPNTGRYDARPRRVRVSDIGRGRSEQSVGARDNRGALGDELRRKQPLLANLLLAIGALAALNVLGNAVSALVRPTRRY